MHSADSTGVKCKYRAFISYSRTDREWATTLQKRLERYVLPDRLGIVTPGLDGNRRPLKPIFRDEVELVPGQDLPGRIGAGLVQSQYLIVVCSPAAAASEWVSKEIREFIGLGRGARIVAVVVDGEPNATAHGLTASLECLPALLRFQCDIGKRDGGGAHVEISARPAELLWIDWRDGKDRDRTTFLRLVAALLSLASLDELIRRDRALRRRQVLLAAAGAGVVASAVLGLGAVLAIQARGANRAKSDTLVDMAQHASAGGDWERAARYAVLAKKGGVRRFIGYETRAADDVLIGALLSNRRIGIPHDLKIEPGAHVALSGDGSLLAMQTSSGAIELFDTMTGQQRGSLQAGKADLLALSQDGRLLVTHLGYADEQGLRSDFKIFDVYSARQVFQTLRGSMLTSTDMQFSPDGRRLAVIGQYGDGGGIAMLYDLAAGTGQALKDDFDPLDSVAFSSDSRLVAVAWREGVQLWSTATGKALTNVMRFGSESAKKLIAVAPDGKTLAVVAGAGTLIFWDTELQRETRTAIESTLACGGATGGLISSLAFSADAHRFGVQCSNGMVRVWEGNNPPHYAFDYAEKGLQFMPGGQFAFLPDDKSLLTLASGTVRLWNLQNYDQSAAILAEGRLARAVYSEDGSILAVMAMRGRLTPLDAKTFIPVGPAVTLDGDSRTDSFDDRLAFSPDREWVADHNPQGVWLVNPRTGQQWRVPDAQAFYGAVVFSPDGGTLALVSDSGAREDRSSEVQRWDVHSHRRIGATIRGSDDIAALAFAADGRSLAVGNKFKPVELWNLGSGARLAPSIAGAGIVAFTPDGRRILTNGAPDIDPDRSQLQLWDIAGGTAVGALMKPNLGEIGEVIFLGDGSRAIVVAEKSIAIWDLAANMSIGTPMELGDQIRTAFVTRDGQELRAVTADGHIYTRNIGRALRLQGHGLIDSVCRTVVPDGLSRLGSEELTNAPVLDPRRDSDACSQ